MTDINAATENVDAPAAWRRTRLIVAFLILAAYAAAAIWWYRECSVLRVGTDPAEATCAPPTVTSATVLVLLFLVVLLLWPDISEITVLGVTLKRRVEQAKQAAAAASSEATEAKAEVRNLTTTVQTLQVQLNAVMVSSANSAAAATVSQTFLLPDVPWSAGASADVQRSVLDLQREAQRRQHMEPGALSGSRRAVNLDAARDAFRNKSNDELKMQLIREWEALDTMLAISFAPRQRAKKSVDDEDRQLRSVQQAFIADHRDTLASVRSLRNAVAHAEEVSRPDVEDGLEALALLRPLADEWLRAYSAPSHR